jgi:tetratricopeptide (TPR) repeat protein
MRVSRQKLVRCFGTVTRLENSLRKSGYRGSCQVIGLNENYANPRESPSCSWIESTLKFATLQSKPAGWLKSELSVSDGSPVHWPVLRIRGRPGTRSPCSLHQFRVFVEAVSRTPIQLSPESISPLQSRRKCSFLTSRFEERGNQMFVNLIESESTERFDWLCHYVKRSPARCLKSEAEAGCAQIREHTERNRSESPWRGALSLAIALLNFVLNVWPLAGQAQVSNPTSPTHAQQFTVSVREMQVPDKARGAFLRGFERLAKADAAGSLHHFARAIQEFPGFYEAYYDKGIAETQLHQWNEALQSFQKSIDLSGGRYACAYFGYSVVLAQQGKPKDAELIVRRGLEEGPTLCLSFGYGVLSIVLFAQNRLDAAEAAAHKALLLPNPSRRNALLALAQVHFKRSEYQLAVQDLEAYLKAVPSTPRKDDAEHNQYIWKLLNEAKAKSVEQNAEGAS